MVLFYMTAKKVPKKQSKLVMIKNGTEKNYMSNNLLKIEKKNLYDIIMFMLEIFLKNGLIMILKLISKNMEKLVLC